MTFSDNKEKERIRELIPLYVQGGLEAKVREEVERAIAEDPELREEAAEWQSIGAGYRELSGSLPGPSPGAFNKVRINIAEKEESGWFSRFFSLPQFAWGVAAAQLAVIIVMGLQMAGRHHEFRTLGAPAAGGSEARVNVVFRENATEADIRRLLLSAGAKIVDGPSPSRCYVISITNVKEADRIVAGFRRSGIVVLAEKSL